jgi:hypothetical protein
LSPVKLNLKLVAGIVAVVAAVTLLVMGMRKDGIQRAPTVVERSTGGAVAPQAEAAKLNPEVEGLKARLAQEKRARQQAETDAAALREKMGALAKQCDRVLGQG